jgi:Zn-dependent M28 family amino/carboxypeptidase
MVENSPKKALDIPKRTLNSRKVNDERPVIPGERRRMSLFQSSIKLPWVNLPTVRVTGDMADVILGFADQRVEDLKAKIEKNYQPNSFSLPGVFFKVESTVEEKLVRSRNVLGYIEGSDPELKDEVVVIGAHLDHLGKRGDYIFNGADDNGSGSAGVMEIAQAFALNPVKPKRSVLFALWTGEEKGLLGSRYYVVSPFFPIEKTVAYINLDMISREWKKDRLKMMARRFGVAFDEKMLKAVDTSKFMSLSMSMSDDIFKTLKENNKYAGMHLHLRKSKSGMGGSDHAPFAFKKVPWLFFMAAMTEDYHQPSDSIEKVSPGLMEKCSRLCWLTAFSLANK